MSRYNYVITEIESLDTSKFPPKEKTEFQSLKKYLEMAPKVIRKFAHPNIAPYMLQSEDAISFVAYNLMIADWSYNEERCAGRSRYSWRNLRGGKRGVQKYIEACHRKKNDKLYSTNFVVNPSDNNASIQDLLQDESSQILTEEQRIERNKKYLAWLLRNTKLTKEQRDYINMRYYQGMTCEQISLARGGVSPQSVSQLIAAAMDKIRTVAGAPRTETEESMSDE